MQKGDICELPNQSGLWIFSGLRADAIPSNAIGKFIKATNLDPGNPNETLAVGIAGVTPVACPIFAEGMIVTHEHEPATVVQDNGDGTVRIEFERRPQVGRYPDEHFHQEWKVDADKPQLVRGNIGKFI